MPADTEALLREAQAIRQENDELITYLRDRAIALNARVRELQEENERLQQAAPNEEA